MEYTPTISTRPDWSPITAVMRLVLVGEWTGRAPSRGESTYFTENQPEALVMPVSRPAHGLGYQIWHRFLNLILVVIVVVVFTWFGPSWWYSLSTGLAHLMGQKTTAPTQATSQKWPSYLQQFNNWFGGAIVTPIAGQSATQPQTGQETPTPSPTPIPYEPPYNPDLPAGNWLVIPRIGIRSELQQGTDSAKALEAGLWQVPDFGKAGSRDMPMIVAGHRYGWDWWWKTDYWKYHSFYLLPKLEVGDQIEVIADQRKWVYQVYAGEEGTEITDYSADLILYTCKDLSSPIRFFRYARLVDPTQNTQAK
jgi:sortase (surface protein transpeptidase)